MAKHRYGSKENEPRIKCFFRIGERAAGRGEAYAEVFVRDKWLGDIPLSFLSEHGVLIGRTPGQIPQPLVPVSVPLSVVKQIQKRATTWDM